MGRWGDLSKNVVFKGFSTTINFKDLLLPLEGIMKRVVSFVTPRCFVNNLRQS